MRRVWKCCGTQARFSGFHDGELMNLNDILDSMVFSKAFAREIEGSNYPRWEEIYLSAQEEREREQVARQENNYLMRQCIADARNIVKDEKLMDMQNHVLNIAVSLFNKRASHAVFYKEDKCKEKFLKYWSPFKDKGTEKTAAKHTGAKKA